AAGRRRIPCAGFERRPDARPPPYWIPDSLHPLERFHDDGGFLGDDLVGTGLQRTRRQLGRPGVDEVPASDLAILEVVEDHGPVLPSVLDLAVERGLMPLVEVHRNVLRALERERRRLVRPRNLLDDHLAVGAVLL